MTTPPAEVPESVTYREVKELLRTFAASDWSGLTLRLDGMTITAGRHAPPAGATPAASAQAAPAQAAPAQAAAPAAPPPAPAAPPPAPAAPPPAPAGPQASLAPPAAGRTDLSGCVAVRSPAVGSFWVAPQPGVPPFAEVGQGVAEGDQLAIVEVMKLMNPVLAPQAGQVAEVCAADADLVEYDQVLFWIRPEEPAGG